MDDLIAPGWTKFVVSRKNGSGRSDSYFLSPPGPNQVKKRSLTQAIRYQELVQVQATNDVANVGDSFKQSGGRGEASDDDEVIASSVNEHQVDVDDGGVGVGDDDEVISSSVFQLGASGKGLDGSGSGSGSGSDSDDDDAEVIASSVNQLKRKKSNQHKPRTFLFDDSDSDSEGDDNDSVNIDIDSVVSVFESVYSCFPSKVRNASSCQSTYLRRCDEFYNENGLSESNPSKGIIECLAALLEVIDPDNSKLRSNEGLLHIIRNPKLSSVDGLIRFIRKEMKKPSPRSGFSLTLCQKHALNQLIGAYIGGKSYGSRSVRWNVHVLRALAKLLNLTIMVISPPLDGQSSVGLLGICPTQYMDYPLSTDPDVFPKHDEVAIESDNESDEFQIPRELLIQTSPQTILENENPLIVRAVMDFDSNKVIGYHAVNPVIVDYGLSDTDIDDDSLVIPPIAAQSRKQAQGHEVLIDDPFVTPKTKKQKHDINHAVVPGAMAAATAPAINPYAKPGLSSGKSASLVAASQGVNDANVSSKGWASSPLVLEQLNKKTNRSSSHGGTKVRSQVVLELTHPITDRRTGELVRLAILSSTGNDLWYLKSNAFNPAFALFFKAGGSKPLMPPASCYNSFKDEFIRSSWHGENKFQRKGRITNGQAPYPVSKPIFEFRYGRTGFPIDVLVQKFQSDFRSMCSDGRVVAAYLYNQLEESGSGMLNMFLEGKFRKGAERNTPYKNESEVKELFAKDIENTFKNGFARIELDNHFDKHFCDFTIQQFLISLGYHSFDELKEEERSLLYKCGRFPQWEDIVEEPISVSI